ncbi:MAG TPA: trypsin-like peptidase domain-containing protein [Mobilitalea sp.]|nr:trypsin-like peptidase domain-containing protein [Mobilitalea sp.]
MKRILKFSMAFLLAFVLSVSAPIMGATSVPQIAMAATSAEPKTTVSKVTLYVGYKTYQIKFANLSKKATVSFKTSKAKVAKVSDSGIITPIAQGNATVTVTIKQNNKTYTSTIKVTVDTSNIKFTAKTGNLSVGDTFTFKAAANGTSSKVTWSVSKKSIGKIDSTSGKFTALKEGEVDVIATAGNISSSCTVNVSSLKYSTESTDVTISDQTIIYITDKKLDSDESLVYSIGDTDILNCEWGDWDGDNCALLLDPVGVGSTTVTITSTNSSQKLVINVKVNKEPDSRPADAKELTAKEIYSKCSPATVELQVTTSDGDYIGSGFFIYSGILITNYHVVEGATKIAVVTSNGKQYDVDSVLGYDKTYDIAVLTINAVTPHLTVNKGDVTVGETVYALGSPRGLTGSLSNGIVSSNSRILDDGVDYIQVTAPISGGNSGGPLLNAYGEVIGINTFLLLDSQNLNFAVNVWQYTKLNYNSPITADAFYEANKQAAQAAEPTEVAEDTSKSGSMSTAQAISNNTYVSGSLNGSNTVDYYKITLTAKGEVQAACQLGNDSDLSATYFQIVNSDQYIEAYSTVYTTDNGNKYLYLDKELEAGDYWVVVYRQENYLSNNIDYGFLIYY